MLKLLTLDINNPPPIPYNEVLLNIVTFYIIHSFSQLIYSKYIDPPSALNNIHYNNNVKIISYRYIYFEVQFSSNRFLKVNSLLVI